MDEDEFPANNPDSDVASYFIRHDRPRGMLSQRDREYLAGERSFEGSHERRVRSDIRERLYHTILDFYYISRHLDQRDLKQVFPAVIPTEDEDHKVSRQTALKHGLESLLEVIFRTTHDNVQFDFEKLLKRAITMSENRANPDRHANVLRGAQVFIEYPKYIEPDEFKNKINRFAKEEISLTAFSDDEIYYLMMIIHLRDPASDIYERAGERLKDELERFDRDLVPLGRVSGEGLFDMLEEEKMLEKLDEIPRDNETAEEN